MDIQKISTQQAIEEALEEIKVSDGHRYDYYMGKIESYAVEWLTHQQSIISQQSAEIERVIAELGQLVQHAEEKAEAFKQKESRMFGLGRVSGLTRAIEMLKEVLANADHNTRNITESERDDQRQQAE